MPLTRYDETFRLPIRADVRLTVVGVDAARRRGMLARGASWLWLGCLSLGACASNGEMPTKTAAPPNTMQPARATESVLEADPAAEPALSATPAPSEIEGSSEAAAGETEACEAACIAASAERSRETTEEIEDERRRCPKAPPVARAKCLADLDGRAAERQYEEDGNQHACRTNCPGYLDQF